MGLLCIDVFLSLDKLYFKNFILNFILKILLITGIPINYYSNRITAKKQVPLNADVITKKAQ